MTDLAAAALRKARESNTVQEAFFSAYPEQTILNVSSNLKLARAMDAASDELDELLATV